MTVSFTVPPRLMLAPAFGEDFVTVQLLFTITNFDHFHFSPTALSALLAAAPSRPTTFGTTTFLAAVTGTVMTFSVGAAVAGTGPVSSEPMTAPASTTVESSIRVRMRVPRRFG